MGYSLAGWTRLRDDILAMTATYPAVFGRESAYGRKFTVAGDVAAPNGRLATLKTIWMLAPDDPSRARFLTAYRAPG